MKRDRLRDFIDKQLSEIGFSQSSRVWQDGPGCSLVLLIGQELKVFSFKTTMKRNDLIFQLGRISGLVEAASIAAAKQVQMQKFTANGAWQHHEGVPSHGAAVEAMGA